MTVLLIINTKVNLASQRCSQNLTPSIHIIYPMKNHNGLNSRGLRNGERGQRLWKDSNNKVWPIDNDLRCSNNSMFCLMFLSWWLRTNRRRPFLSISHCHGVLPLGLTSGKWSPESLLPSSWSIYWSPRCTDHMWLPLPRHVAGMLPPVPVGAWRREWRP
jgi:hypothetical protein